MLSLSGGDSMLKLISDLVSFKTVYSNLDEFDKCISYVKQYFEGTDLIIKEYEQNKAKSVVISNCDCMDFDIILCGHLDVVPADDHMFNVRQEGSILYGRGVGDMKGQDAVMMKLMKNLNTDKKVALFLTTDEERSGEDGVGMLFKKGYNAKIGIIPDGGPNFELVIEEKAVLLLKISTTGRECHSSRLWEGDNAILKLFDIYNTIIHKFGNPKSNDDWKTSFNLAKIEGGDAGNIVPGNASMLIDIRYTKDNTKEELVNFIKGLPQEITVEVIHQGGIFYSSSDNEYVKKYIKCCEEVIGREMKVIKYPAASDARFFTPKNIPCVLSNAACGKIHSEGEWVDLGSLEQLYEIYLKFIERF